MAKLSTKIWLKNRRQERTRTRLHGTATRPRLSVFVSGRNVSAQLIDDDKSVTLVAASSVGTKTEGTLIQKSAQIGEALAAKAVKAGIKQAVFDRGAKLYHGRVKALADAARAKGLEF